MSHGAHTGQSLQHQKVDDFQTRIEMLYNIGGDLVNLAVETFKHIILRTQRILGSNVMGALGGSNDNYVDIISYTTHIIYDLPASFRKCT